MLIVESQFPALFGAMDAHAGILQFVTDGRGCDDEDVGLLAAPAIHAHALADQTLHAEADAGGVHAQTVLGIVGAQHDDQQIDDFVAFQQGIGDAEGVHAFMQRILEYGGAAGETLFGDQKILAQCFLQQAGPAFVFVEADAVVCAVVGVGTVTVGIGVAKAKNMLFHGGLFLSVILTIIA